MEAYCVKCKEKRQMVNPKISRTSRGGYIAKGKCPVCGTKMAVIMSKEKAEKAIQEGAEKDF